MGFDGKERPGDSMVCPDSRDHAVSESR